MNRKIASFGSVLSLVLAAVIVVASIFGFGAVAHAESATTVTSATLKFIWPDELNRYKSELFYADSFRYTASYSLNYRYYKPANAKGKIPLVVCLHGGGERGSDNDSQLNNAFVRPFIENENSKFYGAMVIAPQCPEKEFGNGWVELFDSEDAAANVGFKPFSIDAVKESTECKAIVGLINYVCKNNNIDKNRIYVIGLSQGAMAIWDLLARHSEIFAAAVPIAGMGDPTKASFYADIPIYAFHGMNDNIIEYDKGTKVMYEAIDALGKGKMNFVSFSNGQHMVWESSIIFKGVDNLPALEDWLFSQTKSTEQAGFDYVVVIVPVAVAVAAIVAVTVLLAVRKKKRHTLQNNAR